MRVNQYDREEVSHTPEVKIASLAYDREEVSHISRLIRAELKNKDLSPEVKIASLASALIILCGQYQTQWMFFNLLETMMKTFEENEGEEDG